MGVTHDGFGKGEAVEIMRQIDSIAFQVHSTNENVLVILNKN